MPMMSMHGARPPDGYVWTFRGKRYRIKWMHSRWWHERHNGAELIEVGPDEFVVPIIHDAVPEHTPECERPPQGVIDEMVLKTCAAKLLQVLGGKLLIGE